MHFLMKSFFNLNSWIVQSNLQITVERKRGKVLRSASAKHKQHDVRVYIFQCSYFDNLYQLFQLKVFQFHSFSAFLVYYCCFSNLVCFVYARFSLFRILFPVKYISNFIKWIFGFSPGLMQWEKFISCPIIKTHARYNCCKFRIVNSLIFQFFSVFGKKNSLNLLLSF